MLPNISVIIPAFNAELVIKNAINSILAQNYKGQIEILVIDDSSSDNTRNVVSGMINSYPNIILLSNNRKKGPSGARNTGLIRATGNYIAFLDADDIWYPSHLKEGINFLEKNPDIDIVFYNFDIYEYKTKRLLGNWFSKRNFSRLLYVDKLDDNYLLICDDMFKALLEESFMHLPSMIIRKSILKNTLFNEDISHLEDRDFSIMLSINSQANFAFKHIVTGIYYRHTQSLTSNTVENKLAEYNDQIKLFESYLTIDTLDNTTILKLKELLSNSYTLFGYYNRKSNNFRLSTISIIKSFRYGLSSLQFKELIKIPVSFMRYNIVCKKNCCSRQNSTHR